MNHTECLADWRGRNEALRRRLDEAVRGLDEAAFNQRPAPDIWSPAQVTEHLTLTNGPYLRTIQNALDRATREESDTPIRYSFFGRLIIKAAGPNGNAPAPKALHPRSTTISLTVVEEWRKQQATILALLDGAAGRNLSRIRVRNPFFPILRMNLADCFELLTCHTERHVTQIEERVTQGERSRVSI